MTAVHSTPADVAHPAATPFMLRHAVLALARTEGARLVWHPVMLAGAALSVAFSLAFADATDIGGDYFALIGPTLLPLGLATLVAANLAALRSRRGGTGELYAAAPAPEHARTLAQLLALVWPAAAAVALVAVGFAWFGAWDGLDITPAGRTVTPGVEVVQGPLAVATFGALGVALARWVPHPGAGAVAAVALLVFQMPFMTWNLQGAGGWLLPLVNPHRLAAGVDSSWPCATGQAWPCIFGELAPLGWHLAYLAALAVLLGAAALLRDGRRRTDGVICTGAAAVVLVAGTLQMP